MINKILFAFLLLISVSILKGSDNSEKFSVGSYYNYSDHNYSGDFQTINDNPSCCENFKTGSGNGFDIGMHFKYRFTENIGAYFSIGYMEANGRFSQNETREINVNGQKYPGVINHFLNVQFYETFTNAGIFYNFYNEFKFYGGIASSNLNGQRYYQGEQIIIPSDRGVFLDTGTRFRNENTGNIDNINNNIYYIEAKISYMLPLSLDAKMELEPFAGIKYALNERVKNTNWLERSLFLGVSVNYFLMF